jgi:glycosyltransferase involved in cell wall biosynthesis
MNISILIPSYNTPKEYLIECIKSIINQDCINNYHFEIIWVNDGSTLQNSLDLEDSLELFKAIPTIKLIYIKLSENKGIVDALNIGLDLCSSELIFRMDSDDIMYPARIRKQIDFMEKNTQCMICGTQIQTFRKGDTTSDFIELTVSYHKQILLWHEFLQNPYGWFMNHPTLCFRKKALEITGKYNDTDSIVKFSAMEDFEFELRFLKYFGAVYTIDEPLVFYRIHANQNSQNNTHINPDAVRIAIINSMI